MTRTAYQAVGDMHPRSVTALGLAAGRRFVIALHENARMLGVTTALNTRAVRLGRAEEDGLVRVAVKRTLPGGEVRDEVLRAGGIVIATGGFTADVGRRLLYDDRLTVDVPTTANPQGLYFDGATGDGLDLGAMVGGHTVGMSNIILLPYAGGRLLDYVGGDIYVNSSGERFMNEEMPIYDISEAILAQPGRTCWVITDSRSRKGGTLGLKLADDSNGILAIDLVTGMHKAVGKRAGGREEKKALGIEVKTAHGHPAGARDAGKTRKDGGTAFRVVTGDDFAGHLVVHQNAGRGGGSHRAAHEPALDTNHVRSRNAVTHGGCLTVDGHDAGGDQSLHVAAGSEPSIGERLLKLFGRQIGRRLLLAGAVDDVERDRTIRKAPVAVGLGLHLSEGLARRG